MHDAIEPIYDMAVNERYLVVVYNCNQTRSVNVDSARHYLDKISQDGKKEA